MKIAVMVRHLNNFFNNGDTLPTTFVCCGRGGPLGYFS